MASFSKTDKGYRAQIKILGVRDSRVFRTQREREIRDAVRQAVDDGEYASTSEVVREALREWKTCRQFMQGELATLKADIDQGLADIAAGRVHAFDAERIIAQGKQR